MIKELYLFGPPANIIGAVFLGAVVDIMAYLLPAPKLSPKDIDICVGAILACIYCVGNLAIFGPAVDAYGFFPTDAL